MFSSDLLNMEEFEVCNVGNLKVADHCCSSSQFMVVMVIVEMVIAWP